MMEIPLGLSKDPQTSPVELSEREKGMMVLGGEQSTQLGGVSLTVALAINLWRASLWWVSGLPLWLCPWQLCDLGKLLSFLDLIWAFSW